MAGQSTAARETGLVHRPANNVAYVAVLAAILSAAIHLLLAPVVIGFNQTTGILFYLNAAGWVGGILLFFTKYWRRELYLVAASYALVTIVAFFAMSGRVNQLSIVAKVAETVVALVAVYLYTNE